MKRLLTFFIVSCSATSILSGCKKPDNENLAKHPSYQEALKACNTWQSQGGTWQLQVNDFRISATDQDESDKFPIKVESSNDKIKQDLTSQQQEKELTVYLPLLTSGEDRRQGNQNFEIQTIGEKWLTYDRRLCRTDDTANNTIVGKEYLIDSGEKVLKTSIPQLIIKQTFPFNK